MCQNFQNAFNMSSDTQIHVSKRVCMLFLCHRVGTFRLKNHANHVPSIPRPPRYQFLPYLIDRSVKTNKPEMTFEKIYTGRRYGVTLNERNTRINMLRADMKNKKAK